MLTATNTFHKIGVRAYTPTYNGGGSAAIDLFSIESGDATEIENTATEASFQLGPVPFQSCFTVFKTNSTPSELVLMDVNSRIVLDQFFSENKNFNTEMILPGLYYYRILCNGKSIKSGRIIKTTF
jgi:hypothetical protein